MPSVKTYYVKDLKTDEITPLNADEYSKFTTQMDDIIELPDDFWITGIKKSKYFWERLSSILYDDIILELIKIKAIDKISAERLCDRSTWRGNDELRKINRIKKPFAVNKKLFKEIVNVKKEEQLMQFALKLLIQDCEEICLKKSKSKTWLAYISSDKSKEKYEQYRSQSLVEQYITSLKKELRLISILYFYDGLDSHQIANILKMSSKDVDKKIDVAREQLYEMISNEGTKKYNEYVK